MLKQAIHMPDLSGKEEHLFQVDMMAKGQNMLHVPVYLLCALCVYVCSVYCEQQLKFSVGP